MSADYTIIAISLLVSYIVWHSRYVPADIPVQPDVWNAWLQIDSDIPTHASQEDMMRSD